MRHSIVLQHISALILSSSDMQLLCGWRNPLPTWPFSKVRQLNNLNCVLIKFPITALKKQEGGEETGEREINAPSPAELSVCQYLILFTELNNLNTPCCEHFWEKRYLYLILMRGSRAKYSLYVCGCSSRGYASTSSTEYSTSDPTGLLRFIIKPGSEKTHFASCIQLIWMNASVV